ncbi:MAG: short-chain dehydrogenase [Bradyrhizobium sp.]|nr:short-chain dehydrogenase [Bradyrhizobium sp.]
MAGGEQRVALVTGGSRGAGRGVAVALGREGYTVYVTGRTRNEGDAPLPGTVDKTAQEVDAAGGKGVPVICDHADDAAVARLFEQITDEQGGRLDILVNNATFVHDALTRPAPFWEKPLDLVDIIEVGLRSSYIASWHAAKLMVPRKSGLMAFVSSPGAACYMHGPAYGAQKAGHDKMVYDMGHDLRPFGVSTIALWLGILKTERVEIAQRDFPEEYEKYKGVEESPEFTGRIIHAVATAPDLVEISGNAFYASVLGIKYGVTDIDGRQPVVFADMLGEPRGYNPAVVY